MLRQFQNYEQRSVIIQKTPVQIMLYTLVQINFNTSTFDKRQFLLAVSLDIKIGQVIKQNIKKQQIQLQIRKHPTIFPPQQCNLFINKLTLVIYCIACQKEIFDIFPKFSSQQDLFFIKHQKLNPFKIRSRFLKTIDQENMFISNLQNPESFQKQKSNCAILISPYRNSFLQCAIRLLAFNPSFSSIAQKVDLEKIKSPSFKQLINVIKILRTGKYRILDINEFQDIFFSQFPEYLSYENHDPIKVLFTFFKLIQNQFGWKDLFCHPQKILETPKIQWDIQKNQFKYSPLKQMLLSKTQAIQICEKCRKQKSYPLSVDYFECLSLEVKLQGIGMPFMKKKAPKLNILKGIQNSFKTDRFMDHQEFQMCQNCSQNTYHRIKTVIQPGNYLLFNIQQNEHSKMAVPKDFDLGHLCSDKFTINEEGTKYDFIAGIYKENDQKSMYGDEYGIVVYHIQNNKYLCFSERKITQHQSLNIQKSFLVLLYKRRPNESLLPIIKNLKSTFYLIEQEQLQVDNPVPLPDFYQIFLTQNYKVPPLINPFICHHGLRNVDIEEMTKCNEIKYLPVQIYNFLVDQFGGRKVQIGHKIKEECQLCIKGLEKFHQIKAIEREVMKYADNFSIKKGEVLIYKPWIEGWKAYLYEKSRQNYNLWGNAPPSEINNFLGMRDRNPKQIDHSKYTKISNEVWMTLVAFHSGGPQLTTKKIAKNNSVKNYVNMKIDQASILYDQLLKILSPSAKVFFQKKFNSQPTSSALGKEQHQSQIVSQGSSDQENDKLSIRSASKSRQKQRPKFAVAPRNLTNKK